MKLENKQILDALEHFYTKFERQQTIHGLTFQNKVDLLRVMNEEFWPGYTYDMWCPHCDAKFLQDVYRKYNEWKKAHIEEVTDMPKVKIKATFPKSKMQ
jgi:hypothetical protein